ncbi:uncharacterized protein DEA37_0000494 [Paragonimus westermani]|uniref:Uncharacterized protein n=1 Tax=Paragonimus westermani TaxID=34504 RepID=A0A5J4NZ85_9TREM|nr:uncharacterized protein DEA37_0000494 [Paragonimus westermani]
MKMMKTTMRKRKMTKVRGVNYMRKLMRLKLAQSTAKMWNVWYVETKAVVNTTGSIPVKDARVSSNVPFAVNSRTLVAVTDNVP